MQCWDCLSDAVKLLTCGLVQLGKRQRPEVEAPLLSSPSPRRRTRYERYRQGEHSQKKRGRDKAPDTTHVLQHGHRDIQHDYELRNVLGQGAFGVVRMAVHRRTGLKYAVKTVWKSQLRRRADVEDLRREVQILSLLSSHPNVAALLQTYEDATGAHIVLELCEGGELFERIAAKGVLTEREAAHFMRMMVEVVRHAHALGICHRDIKPENFMLSDSSDKARIKACDFGLSQFYRPGRNFHSLVGSAFYVAPEVLRRDYGPPADVWSLGVCLYTLLSGLLPFFGETEEEVFDMVLHADLDLDTPPWPSVSRHAKDLVRRMLQRDPAKRPSPSDVLQHPWLCEAAPDQPLEQVVGRLAVLHAKNKVHRAAMVVAASRLGREDLPGLHAIFQHLDADKSGTLTAEELRVGLQRQGKSVTDDELHQLVAAADVDGDGRITMAEFVAATLGNSLQQREDFLRGLFQRFDSDGDQQITPDEMQQLLAGFGVTPEDIKAVLEARELIAVALCRGAIANGPCHFPGSVEETCQQPVCISPPVQAHDLDSNGQLDWTEFQAFMSKQTGSLQEVVRRRLSSYEERGSSSGVPADVEEEEEGEERGSSDL